MVKSEIYIGLHDSTKIGLSSWGITTKPMHTALFFKIEPGYFAFG